MSETPIACSTEQSANTTGSVVVIHVQESFSFGLSANFTDAALCNEQLLVVLLGDSVLFAKMFSASRINVSSLLDLLHRSRIVFVPNARTFSLAVSAPSVLSIFSVFLVTKTIDRLFFPAF